jgi:hypothetical protein
MRFSQNRSAFRDLQCVIPHAIDQDQKLRSKNRETFDARRSSLRANDESSAAPDEAKRGLASFFASNVSV